ncbi:hypothetical protein BJV78DRAFT_227359 [Lactifluus subvellereus]|nr:hypothetical protein BJV78DRAFT_227359 [Lactifluus subvellereus]
MMASLTLMLSFLPMWTCDGIISRLIQLLKLLTLADQPQRSLSVNVRVTRIQRPRSTTGTNTHGGHFCFCARG